ncbi:MAG: hypothetical protein SFZ24_07165 [Planctomycetota bacterium]|nr:hypothetical protein [Planctomycetota bacterium]
MADSFLKYLTEQGILAPADADRIAAWSLRQRDPVGIIAVEHGLILGRQIDEILLYQQTHGGMFGEAAVRLGMLTEPVLRRLLDVQQQRVRLRIVEVVQLSGVADSREVLGALARFILDRSECGGMGRRAAA